MPLIKAGRVVLGALTSILVAAPVLANGHGEHHRPGLHRHASTRPLAPETRYRDPRYIPPRRHTGPRFGRPDFLIQAYLPRTTETPIYNEPPSRFPLR